MNYILKPLTGKAAEQFLNEYKSATINIEEINKCKKTLEHIISRKENK